MNERQIVTVIHACTQNDINGNPRRCYVGLDCAGHPVRVTDEGYVGRPDWVRELSDRGVWDFRLTVTPGQYRDLMKLGYALTAR